MDNIQKLKLYSDAISKLKGVENLFGEQVLQKEKNGLSKEDEKLFCNICNSLQSIMQYIFDHQAQINELIKDENSYAISLESVLHMAHVKLHK